MNENSNFGSASFPDPDQRKKKRIVVAMSGGVDSSTTASLLVQEGHEVIGITLKLWTSRRQSENGKNANVSCCALEDFLDAKKVCRLLGIPHYTFDMEKNFKEKVVDDFLSEYLQGKTPNPCVRCNQFIKFDLLLKYAMALDADYLATGHYAKIEKSESETGIEYRLCKAADSSKDQSYFLYMLNQEQLSKLVFPLGNYRKNEVREMAKKMNLSTAEKKESQDICFLEGRNYHDFIGENVQNKVIEQGPIQMTNGKILGRHKGLPFYTIGQREKLGVAVGHPLYVIKKNIKTNTLLVGTEPENLKENCFIHSINWCSGKIPDQPIKTQVKIRYRHPGSPATVIPVAEQTIKVVFDKPESSITPGQTAVFYDGNTVLGGGTVSAESDFNFRTKQRISLFADKNILKYKP